MIFNILQGFVNESEVKLDVGCRSEFSPSNDRRARGLRYSYDIFHSNQIFHAGHGVRRIKEDIPQAEASCRGRVDLPSMVCELNQSKMLCSSG